jgi:NADPH:quinone reductase-like Zn-dependent oxidoreductase
MSQSSAQARTGEVINAWILRKGPPEKGRGRLENTTLTLPPLADDRVLVETLYGSWEGNMTHALDREPIDVCRRLNQDYIVLGNSGVVRVLRSGKDAGGPPEGTVCMLAPVAKQDNWGYVRTVSAYDEPDTMGCLAERFYVRPDQLVPVPDIDVATHRWASFPVRYATAWSNWRVAYGSWLLQMPDLPPEKVHVWAWGGGVAYGELLLAKALGCQTVMIHTGKERGDMIRAAGITPFDRTPYGLLSTNPPEKDRKATVARMRVEREFLDAVDAMTGGDRVSIFIDNIGGPLGLTTIRALGRQGVITTTGWKAGLHISFNRALECIGRHIFVHTHACPLREGTDAVRYAAENYWVPPEQGRIYGWDEVEELAADHAAGKIVSLFPTFAARAAAGS